MQLCKWTFNCLPGISVAAAVATFLLISVFCFLYMRKKRKHSSRSMLLKQSRSIPSLEQSSMHSRDISDVESIQFTHVFPYQELEEATNGFDSKEEIGDGGFGTVYKGLATLFLWMRNKGFLVGFDPVPTFQTFMVGFMNLFLWMSKMYEIYYNFGQKKRIWKFPES